MTEMLTVVGIIVALVAIAIPSVIGISNALRFAKANNYAKSIFLAAQQNLTEMRSDGGLAPVRNASGVYQIPSAVTSFPDEFRTEYVYTVSGNEAMDRVLPAGSIDASIRDDQIVIEYNPLTGNVYAVFYYDKTDLDLAAKYQGGEIPREQDERKKLMVGYYDGSGLNSSQIELDQTSAVVNFLNGEEGIVQVMVPMPETFFGEFDDFANALNVTLTITGEQSIAMAADEENGGFAPQLLTMQIKTSGSMTGCRLDVDGKTVIVEFPLDSLANRSSFVNYASDTQASAPGAASSGESLTTILSEDEFLYNILPGENITIQADVTFDGTGSEMVEITPGILSGVNPMFEYLQPTGNGGYVLAVSNGRNLQNLNALAPTIAKQIETVVFTSDIYWNDTVAYYNDTYGNGSTYQNYNASLGVYDEAPARALPYFVPIHHEDLFGTARFIFPGEGDGGIGNWLESLLNSIFGGYSNSKVPTLTDEMDTVTGDVHATIQGNGHKVLNLNIDSTKYNIPNKGVSATVTNPETNEVTSVDKTGQFYATGSYQIIDYNFTGLFGYVNTPIDGLQVVNPIVKGANIVKETKKVPNYIFIFDRPIQWGQTTVTTYNNPATGALVGAGGFNTLITDCSTYIDKDARGYMNLTWGPYAYDSANTQNWYGVSGTGAVGGLVGYAKSHRSVTGELTSNKAHLAFADCFAAVPVSGTMQGNSDKHFGYSNGVGGFIGNSQLTNFYNCYASGNVIAKNCAIYENNWLAGSLRDLMEVFGVTLDLLYNGRTSMGGGGFVGTSHGTRYTNCFATGNVTAGCVNDNLGGGGFVGFMSIDETFKYGNEAEATDASIAQRTVFTDCYSVGMANTNNQSYENFSGANGRIALKLNTSITYMVGDYFRLYAPYYKNYGTAPQYDKSTYIYRDSYFLSNYHTDENDQQNSSSCASPDVYSSFEDMPGNHAIGSKWMDTEIAKIKAIILQRASILNGYREKTYNTEYFQKISNLETIYKNLYDEGYSPAEWNAATASTTHPYSINAGARYPFSKLSGMDYYGDWPSKPSDVGMAYYEIYRDTGSAHYFFDKNHSDYTNLSLRNGEDVMVTDDGYAIFSANESNLVVTISDNNALTADVTDTLVVSNETYTVANKAYHVFHLSDKLMAALPSDGEFYVKVTAQHVDVASEYTMYFNPNVAQSHVNPVEGKKAAEKPDASPTTIYIRSARQFKGISSLNDFWGQEYTYIQQLNIDASAYNWKDQTSDIQLDSIGTSNEHFDASYVAGYALEVGVEKQYSLSGFQPVEAGLFGYIGEKGSISDLIVSCGDITAGSAQTEYSAVLAGVNYGVIDNVDLTIGGNVTLTAEKAAGLLTGFSTGAVSNCDVNVKSNKNVNITAANAGGLIGSAEGDTNAKVILSNSNVSISGKFTASDSVNSGGIVGKAIHMTADKMNISLNSLISDGEYVGGMAGYAEESAFTGVALTGNTNPVEVTISDSLSAADGYASGVVACAENTTLTGVDVTARIISGNIAAGFLGTGDNIDASNCIVKVTNMVDGSEGAAGVAGTIGSQSVFDHVPAQLSGATVTSDAGNAAGYALEIKGEAYVGRSSVTLGAYNVTTDSSGKVTARTVKSKTTINAAKTAAGYACTIDGSVGDAGVAGHGSIRGDDAAGFAYSVNGPVASSYVSPALSPNAAGYSQNSNANLTVSGTGTAAGFAANVDKKATLSNCYALGSVSGGTNTYGFAGINGGTINRCMANVDIAGGYGFVGINNGLVTTSYGWYHDAVSTASALPMTGSGSCNNSYFADMSPENRKVMSVTVYGADAAATSMTHTALQNTVLAGFTTGYAAYPYTDMTPSEYLYPMLRDHYGSWVTPPQYAYGVAYYETYSDGTAPKIHMIDLSDSTVTEEKKSLSAYIGMFNNEGIIESTGYAMFYNAETGAHSGTKLSLTHSEGGYTYEFYAIEGSGVQNIAKTTSNSASAVIDTRFADAINDTNNTYTVRTAAQLANIATITASFDQTHDIESADVTTAVIGQGHTYNGNGCALTISGQTKTWLSKVEGSVKDLAVSVTGGVNQPVFGTVSGTVELKSVSADSVGESGALVSAVNGSVVVSDKINVTGDVSGVLFASVNGMVETKEIQTGAVNGSLFGTVDASVSTGAITTGAIGENAKIFGSIAKKDISVTVNSISTGANAVAGKVFSSVGAPVTVSNGISTGALSGQLFGDVSANVTVNGNIVMASVTGSNAVANSVSGGTTTLSGITVSSGDIPVLFGKISGGATVTGKNAETPIVLNSGNITGNLFTSVTGNASVKDFKVTTSGTLGSSLVGGNLEGTLSGISLDVAQVTGNAGGILVNNVAAFSIDNVNEITGTITGCTVKAGTVNTTASTFGGLTGENAGTLSDNTVTIDTLTADKSNVVGGLAGINSGTISGKTSVTAAITYTGGTGASIGGLVGENTTDGTITEATVSGSITRGDTSDGIYKIGGAIGNMVGGTVEKTYSAVTVAKDWAKADTTDATFGSSGITNNGPVGMFVGKAENGSLSACSTTADNATFQFIGQASIGTAAFNDTFWKTNVLNTTGIQAYGPASENAYTTFSPDGIVLNAAENAAYVNVTLDDCFFKLGDATYEQVYGVDTYFYDDNPQDQNLYTVSTGPVSANPDNESKTFSSNDYGETPQATEYYFLKNGVYYPVSVKCVATGSWSNPRVFYLVETGNESNTLDNQNGVLAGSIFSGYYYTATWTLYKIAEPTLNGELYVAVNAAGNMLDSDGVEHIIPENRTFEQRNALYACVWTANGTKITNLKTGAEYPVTSTITYDSTLRMTYSVDALSFELYPLTSVKADYTLVTFSYLENADYQRQFITYQ